MKSFSTFFALLVTLVLTSCGGGGNKDADAFCECMKNETEACGNDMEALEDEFKKDEARYNAFKEAAMKKCPEHSNIIERLK